MLFRKKMILCYLLPAVVFPNIAVADMADFYIGVTCNPNNQSVSVSPVVGWNEAAPKTDEKDVYPVEDLPAWTAHKRPRLVCDFGKGKVVSVRAWQDAEHPRNNGVLVYVNDVPIKNTLQFEDVAKMRIYLKGSPKILYCAGDCEEKEQLEATGPNHPQSASFDCNKAQSPIDKLICTDQWLPAADKVMAALFHEAMEMFDKRPELLGEQREWLKSRAPKCGLPDRGEMPLELDDAKARDCLDVLYQQRITALNEMMAAISFKQVEELGLLGAWAENCQETTGYANEGVIFEKDDKSDKAVVKHSDGGVVSQGRGSPPNVVVNARKDGELITVRESGLENHSDSDVVSFSISDGKIRVISVVTDGGAMFVKDGVVIPGLKLGGKQAPWLTKCENYAPQTRSRRKHIH